MAIEVVKNLRSFSSWYKSRNYPKKHINSGTIEFRKRKKVRKNFETSIMKRDEVVVKALGKTQVSSNITHTNAGT